MSPFQNLFDGWVELNLILIFLAMIFAIPFYLDYLKTTVETAIVTAMIAGLLAAIPSIYTLIITYNVEGVINQMGSRQSMESFSINIDYGHAGIFQGYIFFFAIPLGMMLYSKWVQHKVTEAEQQTGIEGARAWLNTGNLICCLGFAIFSTVGFGQSFMLNFVLCLLLVLAYPLIRSIHPEVTTPESDLLERTRAATARLLDEGKITPDAHYELLELLKRKQPKDSAED